MIDALSREHFEVRFELAFLKKKGDEFQDFFASIMEKGYPGDFTRVRPWGNVGDKKNDGYLKSTKTIFQVYGPNELEAGKTIAKINEDFTGMLTHWKDHVSTWVFVHNSNIGLGPDVLKTLLDLNTSCEDVEIFHWGFEELRRETFRLGLQELASLFGPAPTQRGLIDLRLPDLIPVLEQLSLLPAGDEQDLRPVPADKVQRNMLSEHVGNLLRAGMSRANLVTKYFRTQPTLQDRIAESFRAKYQELRTLGLSPDQIFVEIQCFAGGKLVPSASQQNAILAVLAYFFEACDIFERVEPEEDK
ncbi:MAG TPA: ABC-three component system protein [Polyangiaceae bacterium]|nr:ABC-three component system protein [Polyangiaceae bacterium]